MLYAVALGLGAAALQWLDYRHAIHTLSSETYIVLLAIGFTALGLWGGNRLTRRPPLPGRNHEAIRALGLTARECEILELLARGQSNKEMARSLHISPNTVKTHVASIYEKLEVQRRVQAVEKARWLALIGPEPRL